MIYANLLLHIENGIHTRRTTRVSAGLAYRFDAHLTAAHIHIPTYRNYVPLGSYPVTPTSESIRRVRAEAKRLDSEMREKFQQRAADIGAIHTEWHFHQGEMAETHIADTLAAYARCADLVVMHKHDVRDRDSQTSYDTPALVAMASSRPVLVLPHSDPDPLVAKRLVIGWNGAIESVRAVTAALPFARQAEQVELVEVIDGNDDQQAPAQTQPDGHIERYLEHHGVRATYKQLYRGASSVSETLQSQVADSGADLLVTGVYGHSRLRELVFGGVTFELLRAMVVPTLLVG